MVVFYSQSFTCSNPHVDRRSNPLSSPSNRDGSAASTAHGFAACQALHPLLENPGGDFELAVHSPEDGISEKKRTTLVLKKQET